MSEMHCPSWGVGLPERTADHYDAKPHVHPQDILPPRYSWPFVRTRRGAWSLIRVWSNTGASTPFLTAMPGFHRKRNEEDWDGWTVDGPFLGGLRLPVIWPVSVMRSKTGTTEFTWCYTYIDISFMLIYGSIMRCYWDVLLYDWLQV